MGAIVEDELLCRENSQEEVDREALECRDNNTANRFSNGGGIGNAGAAASRNGVEGEAVAGASGGSKNEKIRVSVRLRPLNVKERARNDQSDWECINDTTVFFKNSLPERSMFPTAYTFDRVFRYDCTTKQVYEEGAKEVALSVVSGINASIFAYGQTSSGKTYTMTGITEYAMSDIYEYINGHKERAYILRFSAMEIYNEAVRDLLNPENAALRLLDDPERGTIVEKLTEEMLRDWDHMKQLLSICEAQRQIGETCLNETSSRSHQILRLTLESSAREFLGKENSSALAATVNFVDLAGSERASQALSAGTRLKEGCHINRSLLTLGTVIRKLSKGRGGHIPYRDSKLTRILQASLGGNARTAIICTLSPARSHVEQSRNTLLFASCAKEVVTSAQVNVVMSDKALVKHLQKELARLESELRYPGPTSSQSYTEALLKGKDAQIQKMEKEIKELIQQRDVAQSRIQYLIKAVEYNQESRPWDGFSRVSGSHIPSTCDDEFSLYDSSDANDFGFLKSDTSQGYAYDSVNYDRGCMEILENLNKYDVASPIDSVSTVTSAFLPHEGGQITSQDDSQDVNDKCKDVRCIEIEETSPSKCEQSSDLLPEKDNSLHLSSACDDTQENMELTTKFEGDKDINTEKSIELSGIPSPSVSPAQLPMQVDTSSRHLTLSRSRSCRAILMNGSPSCWFLQKEQTKNTPPSISFGDFPGRPEMPQRIPFSLNYTMENNISPKDGFQASERALSGIIRGDGKTEAEDDLNDKNYAGAEWKDMKQIQSKELIGHQMVEEKTKEHGKIKSVKDAGLNPMVNSELSASHWLEEFEMHQLEIIELWHACNVSLVHRTYFFLLIKGDPADSIYMEVELRRLYFLKRVFMEGNVYKWTHSHNVTLSSSARALKQERRMLCRQMHKRLTAKQRESTYLKWGIPLGEKQRKIQLSHLIWSETGDLEHARESASVVAKLIGLLEPDEAFKEMFGLAFTPQRISS